MADSSPPQLVPATLEDLGEGMKIYVHGRAATIVSVDFPLVFFVYDGDSLNLVKHRSYIANQEVFQVPEQKKEGSSTSSLGSSVNSQPDESKDASSPDGQRIAPNAVLVPHPNPSQAFKNLTSAFLLRPPKYTIINQQDTTIECDARSPQAVHISECENVTVNVANKVTTLTIHKCLRCVINFASAISATELISSSACKVTCSSSCSLYTLDDSTECTLQFPAAVEQASFVSIGSSKMKLVAQPSPGDNEQKAISFDFNEPFSDPHDSRNSVRPQFTVKWTVVGRFSEVVSLHREGIGYITNL